MWNILYSPFPLPHLVFKTQFRYYILQEGLSSFLKQSESHCTSLASIVIISFTMVYLNYVVFSYINLGSEFLGVA